MDRLKAASGRRPTRRDEDEDEKPQRRGRDADEDEEKPQRRARDDDEDDRPQRGRGKREEADEEEDGGRRGGRKPKEVEMEDAGSKPAARGGRGKAGGGLSAAISEHMKQYDEIKDGLVKIRSNTALIDKMKEKEQKAVNEKERKENMAELDRIMSETSNMATKIKNSLDKIKAENDQYAADKANQNSATNQMRINMYQTHIRRFHQEMNAYNQAAQDFKTTLKDRTRRQLPILIKDITPEKVEEIVESGQADKVISQALISEDLDNVIAQIEERHQGIAKLERQVLEVYELFRDLATLVDLQQETMDVISERIDRAKDYTADAEKELRSAQEHQRKARQRQCCILFIVVGILVGILAPVIWTQVNK